MKTKMPLIYGYIVCIVCVITFIISTGILINAIIDAGDPLYSGFQRTQNLASFDNFKADALKDLKQDAAYIPDDAKLQEMFESAKNEVIARANHGIRKNIIVNVSLIIMVVIIFGIHWRWMQRLNRKLPAVA